MRSIIEAQDAVIAISITLQSCLEPEYTSATVEIFLTNAEEYAEIRNDAEKQINMLANHPLLSKELAKQSEDLQRLQSTQTLDSEFLDLSQIEIYAIIRFENLNLET
ncbi:MAG: DUF416 family protein [Hormoscilla sp. GM102CHS1]|nr:DUF416 family protein [Hormoscilla sp. GM102CHS1]MBO1347978.1 DUF416 family protein [Hormoscilla sp. GUM202]